MRTNQHGTQTRPKKSHLDNRIAVVKAKSEELEAQFPALETRLADLGAERRELEAEYSSYFAYCNVTVSQEELPQRVAECDAWWSRYSAWQDDYGWRDDQYNRDRDAVVLPYEDAIAEWDRAATTYEAAESEQQSLAVEGAALEQESAELAERGQIIQQRIFALDALIIEHQDTPCDPNDFSTAEAFEECVRGIYDGGRGPGQLAPPPWSPYDLDPSVVKPNWN